MNTRLIRTLYLYLFAAIGLVLVIVGTVQLVDLGLRTLIFRSADTQPPVQPTTIVEQIIEDEKVDLVTLSTNLATCGDTCKLTADEQASVKDWIADYKTWQENEAAYDAVKSRRQRIASGGIASIVIGIPIFIYHWLIIRRELKSKKEKFSKDKSKDKNSTKDEKKEKSKDEKKNEKDKSEDK